MAPRANRNLLIGERRYRRLSDAILSLEEKQGVSPGQPLTVRLDVLADRLGMSRHRVAHLMREIDCDSQRVWDPTIRMPVTVCQVPGSVRTFLRDLMSRGEWGWGSGKALGWRVTPETPSMMETWEGRLQELRLRLHREPTQAEMLKELPAGRSALSST